MKRPAPVYLLLDNNNNWCSLSSDLESATEELSRHVRYASHQRDPGSPLLPEEGPDAQKKWEDLANQWTQDNPIGEEFYLYEAHLLSQASAYTPKERLTKKSASLPLSPPVMDSQRLLGGEFLPWFASLTPQQKEEYMVQHTRISKEYDTQKELKRRSSI